MYERAPGYKQGEQSVYVERPETLQPLNDLRGWRLGEEYPDIRGWSLCDINDEKIGSVDDFLVNTSNGEIIFAIVSYGGTLGVGEKKTLIPLNHLELFPDDERAYIGTTKEDLDKAPEYKKDVKGFSMFYDYWGQAATPTRREPSDIAESGRRVHIVGPEFVDEEEE